MGEAVGEAFELAAHSRDAVVAPTDQDLTADQARLIIFNPTVMLVGQGAFYAVAALIYMAFAPVVPITAMREWLALLAILLTIIVVFDAVFFLRPADDSRRLLLYRAVDKKQTILFDLVAMGVIWLLLPHGGEVHRIITVAFCVGYVPLQMISDPENTFGNRFSVVTVLGSFGLFLLMQREAAMTVLALMVALYGATLFYAADKFRGVVVSALQDRRELERANLRLADALHEVSASRDAKTRFISAASHDLGQPLQAASLFADQAIDATELAAKDRVLVKLSSAVDSAQAMLGHILYSMRLEADAVTPLTRPADIAALCEGLAIQFANMAAQNAMTIEVAAVDVAIETDPVLLERALGNLLHNAISHSGGTRVRMSASANAQRVIVSVADNGVGIPETDRALLYDDYSQGANVRSPVRGGFGLGLASVKRIALLLGGEVRLATTGDGGAEFLLDLPRQLAHG